MFVPGRRGRTDAAAGTGGRRRQGLPVQFAVRGQGDGGQVRKNSRDHVVGQFAGRQGAQVLGSGGAGVVGQNAVGRFAVGHGHGAVNLRVGGQRGLDLAEFDPETADLDLLIRAGEELQRAVRRPADQVAGAVHPAAVGGEGVGHETGGGLGGAPVVAARHAWTGQVQLARDAGRHQRQVLVQDKGVRIGDAAADGQVLPPLISAVTESTVNSVGP